MLYSHSIEPEYAIMSETELDNRPIFDAINRAQRSAQLVREDVLRSIQTHYQHPNHELTGDFPVVYQEVVVEHAQSAEPLIPSIPLIVTLSPGVSSTVLERIQIIQPEFSMRRYLTFAIDKGEFGYFHPTGMEDDTTMRFNIFNLGIPLSNMQALQRQQEIGISATTIHTLGVHFFMYHAQNDRMMMDAVFFPVKLRPEHFAGFDTQDWAWTSQALEKKKEELLAVHETYAPIPIDTEYTPRILRDWQRNRQDVYNGLVYALSSEADVLKQSEVVISPGRELSWGNRQQIKGHVSRIGYWNNGPVVSEMQFTLKDVSATGLQTLQLQKARSEQDALKIELSVGISGDTVAMHISHTGAYHLEDSRITNPELQAFWIKVLSTMRIHSVTEAKNRGKK